MIVGFVTSELEAVVSMFVKSADGLQRELRATIDTGFNHYLALPAATIEELGLTFEAGIQATLADGRTVPVDVYRAIAVWDQQDRDIVVLSSEGGPLIGMALLEGFHLQIDVRDGGDVAISAQD